MQINKFIIKKIQKIFINFKRLKVKINNKQKKILINKQILVLIKIDLLLKN